MKYRMNSKYTLASPFSIDADISGFVTQSALLDGKIVYVLINKKTNEYSIVRAIESADLNKVDMSSLLGEFIEEVETEEQAKQRRAIEHLQKAALEMGYDLVKK